MAQLPRVGFIIAPHPNRHLLGVVAPSTFHYGGISHGIIPSIPPQTSEVTPSSGCGAWQISSSRWWTKKKQPTRWCHKYHMNYIPIKNPCLIYHIFLYLVDLYGQCRHIYHTWILWDIDMFYLPSKMCRKLIQMFSGLFVDDGRPSTFLFLSQGCFTGWCRSAESVPHSSLCLVLYLHTVHALHEIAWCCIKR